MMVGLGKDRGAMPWCPTCLIEYEWSLSKRRKLANLESQYFKQTLIKSHQLCDLENLPHSLLDHFFALLLVKLWTLTFKSECTHNSLPPSMTINCVRRAPLWVALSFKVSQWGIGNTCPDLHFLQCIKAWMSSTDPVFSITNCYSLIVSYTDPVHSFIIS